MVGLNQPTPPLERQMKHLLITTIAAVALVGCGESQQTAILHQKRSQLNLLPELMQNQKRLSLKRHHRLFARGYFQNKSSVARQPLHNSTGSKCDAFQEKPPF